MSYFEIDGRTFRKSSRSDTDWTRNRLGVAASDCRCHTDIAESVTGRELPGLPAAEFAGYAAAADAMECGHWGTPLTRCAAGSPLHTRGGRAMADEEALKSAEEELLRRVAQESTKDDAKKAAEEELKRRGKG